MCHQRTFCCVCLLLIHGIKLLSLTCFNFSFTIWSFYAYRFFSVFCKFIHHLIDKDQLICTLHFKMTEREFTCFVKHCSESCSVFSDYWSVWKVTEKFTSAQLSVLSLFSLIFTSYWVLLSALLSFLWFSLITEAYRKVIKKFTLIQLSALLLFFWHSHVNWEVL